MSVLLEDEELHEIRRVFGTFDTDCSGAIILDEVNKAFNSLHKHYSKQDFQQVLKHIDLNEDGYITFHEFLSLYKQLLAKEQEERKMRKAFRGLQCR